MQRHKSRCTAPKAERTHAGWQELNEHHQSQPSSCMTLHANSGHVERCFMLLYRRTAPQQQGARMPGRQVRAQQLLVLPSNIILGLASSSTLLQHSEMQKQLCRDVLNFQQGAQWGSHQQMSGTAICLRA